MRMLIAVCSCQRDLGLGCHEVIRNSWGKQFPNQDILFFVGGPEKPDLLGDERWLDCDDRYMGLPKKIKKVIEYAYCQGYDFIFKCDVDTVLLDRPYLSNVNGIDYFGYAVSAPGEQFYFQGGGYGLSRKAMAIVIEKADDVNNWAEDVMVGEALRSYARIGAIRALRLERNRVFAARAGHGEPHPPAVDHLMHKVIGRLEKRSTPRGRQR